MVIILVTLFFTLFTTLDFVQNGVHVIYFIGWSFFFKRLGKVELVSVSLKCVFGVDVIIVICINFEENCLPVVFWHSVNYSILFKIY